MVYSYNPGTLEAEMGSNESLISVSNNETQSKKEKNQKQERRRE